LQPHLAIRLADRLHLAARWRELLANRDATDRSVETFSRAYVSTMRAQPTAVLMISFTTIAALGAPVSTAMAVPLTQSVIYTSPHGSGSACTKPTPCSIETGFTTAEDGMTLIIGAGTYGSENDPLTSPLLSTSDALVEGEPGEPNPVVYSQPTTGYDGIFARGSLRHLTIFYGSGSPAHTSAFSVDGAEANHLVAFNFDTSSYNACDMEPLSTFASISYSDLECYSATALGDGDAVQFNPNQGQPMAIRGVTAIAPGAMAPM
jgi:hypothetical protein